MADDVAALLDHLDLGPAVGRLDRPLTWRHHRPLVAGLVLAATSLEWRTRLRERVVWNSMAAVEPAFRLGTPEGGLADRYLRSAVEQEPELGGTAAPRRLARAGAGPGKGRPGRRRSSLLGLGAATRGGSAIDVGIVGKTGSGKTTVAALVALAAASRGRRVAAVDTDDPPNLGLTLGLGPGAADRAAVPRALARGRGGGGVTPERLLSGYGEAAPGGVTLLHALRADDDERACGCAAHSSGRSLLASALHEAFDVVVLDLESGIGHADRVEGTMAALGALFVVVDASRKSLITGGRLADHAGAAGIAPVAFVGNQAGDGDAEAFAAVAAGRGVPLAGVVPRSAELAEADRSGAGIQPVPATVAAAAHALLDWVTTG